MDKLNEKEMLHDMNVQVNSIVDICNKESIIEYLGLPYTTDDKFLLNFRAEISNLIASKLMTEGRIIFAPISAWHHIALKYDLPMSFEYWKKLDREFIKISKKVLIITLPGWEKSRGVSYEIEIANRYNKEIEYIDPMLYIEFLK